MLSIRSYQGTRHCDGLTRREVLRAGAIGLGGLTLPGLLRLQEAGARPAGKARSVILLFLSGGPSHLDMWDLKPDAPVEYRGQFNQIQTNVPGVRICEHMPRQARMWDKLACVRSAWPTNTPSSAPLATVRRTTLRLPIG